MRFAHRQHAREWNPRCVYRGIPGSSAGTPCLPGLVCPQHALNAISRHLRRGLSSAIPSTHTEVYSALVKQALLEIAQSSSTEPLRSLPHTQSALGGISIEDLRPDLFETSTAKPSRTSRRRAFWTISRRAMSRAFPRASVAAPRTAPLPWHSRTWAYEPFAAISKEGISAPFLMHPQANPSMLLTHSLSGSWPPAIADSGEIGS